MFGYVKPIKAQLRVFEDETYRAAYCTLCKQMGKKYGHIARMTLSYDFTFLAILNLSIGEGDPEYVKKHCVYNPFRKCTYMVGKEDVFDFVAAAAIISVYGKILDNICDSKGMKRFFYSVLKAVFKRKYKKAAKLYPEVAKSILDMVKYQFKVEENQQSGIDEASEPTANAMKEIFPLCGDGENQKRILAQLGYCIGKWIYLIDAISDLDDDIKKDNFNPLKNGSAENAVMTMNFCSAQAGAALELLDVKRFGGILQNIIYLGLTETAESKISGGKENKQ